MYVFCCLQWGDRRRKDECSGGGKKPGKDGQGGGASQKQKFFFLVNEQCSQNLRLEKVVLRQQTTRHFLKAGILFPQSSKLSPSYLLHRGKYLTAHKTWV